MRTYVSDEKCGIVEHNWLRLHFPFECRLLCVDLFICGFAPVPYRAACRTGAHNVTRENNARWKKRGKSARIEFVFVEEKSSRVPSMSWVVMIYDL